MKGSTSTNGRAFGGSERRGEPSLAELGDRVSLVLRPLPPSDLAELPGHQALVDVEPLLGHLAQGPRSQASPQPDIRIHRRSPAAQGGAEEPLGDLVDRPGQDPQILLGEAMHACGDGLASIQVRPERDLQTLERARQPLPTAPRRRIPARNLGRRRSGIPIADWIDRRISGHGGHFPDSPRPRRPISRCGVVLPGCRAVGLAGQDVTQHRKGAAAARRKSLTVSTSSATSRPRPRS